MKNILIIIITVLVSFCAGWFTYAYFNKQTPIESLEEVKTAREKPMEKYAIENLEKEKWKKGPIRIDKVLAKEKEYTSYLFSFIHYPAFDNEQKITTGQINIPNEGEKFSLILMFRGYVDQKLYSTGTGTRPSASFFAKNGYMTIAPDFLGYAGSDSESGNIFETRFQTYTTAISLLKAIEQMKSDKTVVSIASSLENSSRLSSTFTDYESLNLWAHSNGGQIALTTLEVTKSKYPTTLWAPVTKPFPYSVLYYTDESADGGKFIRKELSKFEELYDVDKYALTNYIENIEAPLQFHQGGEDDAIPMDWTDEFVYKLKSLNKEVTYWKYAGADHNMRPNWDLVVERDLDFFQKYPE